MRRSLALAVLVCLGLCRAAAGGAPSGARGRGGRQVGNQYLVRFRPGTLSAARARLHASARGRSFAQIADLDLESVALPSPAAARVYAADPSVLWIEPNRPRHALVAAPNDPAYTNLDTDLSPDNPTWFKWDAHKIQTLEGWSIWPNRYYTAGDASHRTVRLAVIDSGVDYNHPDFENAGASTTDSAAGGQLDQALDRSIINGQVTPGALDVFGHGTHVTGIAAAATNNGAGTTGNGYNATVLSLRTIDATGNGTAGDVAAAITYAADHGALICNISLGDYDYSQAEQDAVNYAWGKGTLVIAAAGNDGSSRSPNYPAALDRVLAVSATSEADALASYSNSGTYVGVAAPGGDLDFDRLALLGVYSTMPTYDVPLNGPEYGAQHNYDYLMGTSMASPQVAGLAALYAGYRGYIQSTPDVCRKIWQAIELGCDNIAGGDGNWEPNFGFGRIDIYNTLNLDAVPNPRAASSGCITGQVSYRGTPVANAAIVATRTGSGSTVSGTSRVADGNYRVAGVTPGTYAVSASVFGESQSFGTVTVSAGCDVPAIDFNIGSTTGAPPAPIGLTAAAASTSEIDLAWTEPGAGATQFLIERADGTGVSFSQVGTAPANQPSYADTGLAVNHTYSYRVRASNGATASGYSGTAVATTLSGPPSAPAGLTAVAVSSSEIDLSWTESSSDVTSFRIEIADAGSSSFSQAGTVGGTQLQYASQGLAAGRSYSFRVRAAAGDTLSDYSSVVTAGTLPAAPDPPTALVATTASATEVDLGWSEAGTGVTLFLIERSDGGTTAFRQVGTVPGGLLTYADTGLTAGGTYYYRLRAGNGAATSAYSAIAGATTLPNAATGLSVGSATATSLHLAWTDGGGGGAFLVERKGGAAASYSQMATLAAGVVSYTDTGLSPSTTYTYRVSAYNAGGTTAPSNEAAGVTLPGLASLALSAATVKGGRSVTATLTLTGAAPAGGATIQLTSDDPSTVPIAPRVTIRSGATQARLTIRTKRVTTKKTVHVIASYAESTANATLSVSR